jgi:dipeptidyl aminopeptidase/acylaminoacyl peptidase
VWWHDDAGTERGHWVAAPFAGGAPQPLVRGVPDAWSTGLSFAGDRVAIGLAGDDGYAVYVADGERPARLLFRDERPTGLGREDPEGAGGLSADGRLVCLRHAQHGDITRLGLRVLDAGTGDLVGAVDDDRGTLQPVAWSPVEPVLVFTSELGSHERPAVWDLRSGVRRDLAPDVAGAVIPLGWFPDGRSVLARHEHAGRDRLVRVGLDDSLEPVTDFVGHVEDAAVRPDGEVWLSAGDSVRPPRILRADGVEVVPSPDEPAPPGRPYRSLWATNPAGDRIQAFVATPEGTGPFPTVVSVHGGPEWHERDRFHPETQAFVDAGYAVLLPNYRGSTGYGVDFRRAIMGRASTTETEDIIACVDALVADGIADPERLFWSGWSYGGCLGCFAAGTRPERWRAIFAGIPLGDYVAGHYACAPTLQAWDIAVHGGTPDEVPEVWAAANPMTYVDRVQAPVLVIAGEADSRCPIEGVTPWTDAVRAAGVEIDVVLYPTGHHANDMGEQVQHMRLILDFFDRYG